MQWTLNDPDVDVERSEVVAERDMAKLRAVVRVAQPSGQVTVGSTTPNIAGWGATAARDGASRGASQDHALAAMLRASAATNLKPTVSHTVRNG